MSVNIRILMVFIAMSVNMKEKWIQNFKILSINMEDQLFELYIHTISNFD
jgi:hypothetical protein